MKFPEVPEDSWVAGGLVWKLLMLFRRARETQRDLILEAVEVLKTLLGQGVGTQVVDLIQEDIPPPPQDSSGLILVLRLN